MELVTSNSSNNNDETLFLQSYHHQKNTNCIPLSPKSNVIIFTDVVVTFDQ